MNRKTIITAGLVIVLLGVTGLKTGATPPSGSNAAIAFTSDFSWIIGGADYFDADGDPENGSTFLWRVNGTNVDQGPVKEGLLLHFDGSANGTGGEAPSLVSGAAYTGGMWGAALVLATNGTLRFSRTNNLFLDEGTIEMWVALQFNGSDPVYTNRWQPLFYYKASSANWMSIAQSESSGVLYAGGVVSNQWQSAYSSRASMRGWPSNQWHHLAFTFSASNNYMRFYLDGVKVAENNEGHYWQPPATGTSFQIGGDGSTVARYRIDEVRISGRTADDAEIGARARRASQPRANEVWMNMSAFKPGDTVTFQFTPSDGSQTGAPCPASAFLSGIPLTNASPPSNLLPPGSGTLAFSVESITNTSCRYSLGTALPYAEMAPFDSGSGTRLHQTLLTGLDTNPGTLNHVYVRCAAFPDYVMHLRYRCLSSANPPFPRKGNLWGWSNFIDKGLPYMARIDLWLGADGMTADQIVQLRALNTNVLVLSSMNAVENDGLADDFYLKDIHGNKIEVWPGSYRLNLTKTNVAEYQARFAYQTWLDSGCQADGVFFDNVFTSQSWLKQDIYGNTVQLDANEDGVADDPDTLNAAWKAGIFHELETFRTLMPHAILSGHALDVGESTVTNVFNGISIGFRTADIIEGEESFSAVWDDYNTWCNGVRAPRYSMIESSPLDDFAYGYDYEPLSKVPTNTVAFARDYYPWMRFGLAFTLMQDGYFAHEWGDTDHGQDWWYDELDFNLGHPLGPAERTGQPAGTNYMVNGGFETAIVSPWKSWIDNSSGCTGMVSRVTDTAAAGSACVRLAITATRGEAWRFEFSQYNRSLVSNVVYELVFWARADAPRSITLSAQKGSPDWGGYGLYQTLSITTNWVEYTVRFTANDTVSDSRIQFLVGATNGVVWLDDVRLREAGPDLYRREFDNGLVLLNATRQAQTLAPGCGYRRLTGTQAPRFQWIVDDADTTFTTGGSWSVVTNDSGEWKASGPFYHDWGSSCHLSAAATNSIARWSLAIPSNDTYTVEVWWPDVPSNSWSGNVLFEIVTSAGTVVATNLSQRSGGDRWHAIASVPLPGGTPAIVQGRCLDGAAWIADAIHIRSASRYNDGSSAASVTLQPMDGIILQREPGTFADRDQDGLPDFWELRYFGNVTNATSAADPDADGFDNLQEWTGGSDPTNRDSFFRILTIESDDQSAVCRLTWQGITNRIYDVMVSTNPADGFVNFVTGLTASPPLGVCQFTQQGMVSPGRFYRIRAMVP
jgi:hypothetical protein